MAQIVEEYDVKKSIAAQKELCERKGYIRFAPYDGYCHRCHGQIYNEEGYSTDYAKTVQITGCPHCHASFCD